MSKRIQWVVIAVALLVFSSNSAIAQTYFQPHLRTQYRMMWEFYGVSPFHQGSRQRVPAVVLQPRVALKPALVNPERSKSQLDTGGLISQLESSDSAVPTSIADQAIVVQGVVESTSRVGKSEPVRIEPSQASVLEPLATESKLNLDETPTTIAQVEASVKSKLVADPSASPLEPKNSDLSDIESTSLSDGETADEAVGGEMASEVNAKVEKLQSEKQEIKQQLQAARKQARTLEQRARNAERQLDDVRKSALEVRTRDQEVREELEAMVAKMKADQNRTLAEKAVSEFAKSTKQTPANDDSAKVIDRLKKANANLSRKTVQLQRELEQQRRANRPMPPRTPTRIEPQSALEKTKQANAKPASVLQSLAPQPSTGQSASAEPGSAKRPMSNQAKRPLVRSPKPPKPPKLNKPVAQAEKAKVTTGQEKLKLKIAEIRKQQSLELTELLDRVKTRFERRLNLLDRKDPEFSEKKMRLEQERQQTTEIIKARNQMRFEGKINALKAANAKQELP